MKIYHFVNLWFAKYQQEQNLVILLFYTQLTWKSIIYDICKLWRLDKNKVGKSLRQEEKIVKRKFHSLSYRTSREVKQRLFTNQYLKFIE